MPSALSRPMLRSARVARGDPTTTPHSRATVWDYSACRREPQDGAIFVDILAQPGCGSALGGYRTVHNMNKLSMALPLYTFLPLALMFAACSGDDTSDA